MAEFNLGGGKLLDLDFATQADERKIREWEQFAGLREGNPNVRDALELSKLALMRWGEAKAKLRDADNLEDFKDRIRDEKYAEVSGLLVARPIWTNSRHLAVLGLCNFRRTWCNNIVLDYLTVHPAIVRRLPKHAKNAPPPIRGVGLALFYFLSTLAVELNVGTIWGEATQNSAVRYQVWFQQPDLNDLIRLTDEDFKNFIRRTETKERP